MKRETAENTDGPEAMETPQDYPTGDFLPHTIHGHTDATIEGRVIAASFTRLNLDC
jgi:hypothetical protein